MIPLVLPFLFNTVIMKQHLIISAALKKAFVAEKSIQKMAKEDFVMLNLVVIKDLLHMKKLSRTEYQTPAWVNNIKGQREWVESYQCFTYGQTDAVFIMLCRKTLQMIIRHLMDTMFPEYSLLVSIYTTKIIICSSAYMYFLYNPLPAVSSSFPASLSHPISSFLWDAQVSLSSFMCFF